MSADIKMSFSWKDDFLFAKIGIFCKSIAGQMDFVWRHVAKIFMQNSSQWNLRNVQSLRTTVNWCWWLFTLTFCQGSNILVCTYCILAFHASVYRWGCQFHSLYSQDNEHTELKVLLFFQNLYAIFAYILQHYHDFQSNVVIFASVVQAYTESHSLGGGIKLIICQIRDELSVYHSRNEQ